ncbi:MAG TPA: hypothetical protein VMX79_04660, partial [bacterium]|nr:hypothetical protein [bacterium]
NAEGYLKAAIQRFKEATWLKIGAGEKGIPAKTYAAGAIYLSGIAAECLYRAFIVRAEPTADIRPHDLRVLADDRFMKEIAKRPIYDKISRANKFIYEAWANEHRYRDNESLGKYYKKHRRGLCRGIKGDVVKYICARMLTELEMVFKVAKEKWQRPRAK